MTELNIKNDHAKAVYYVDADGTKHKAKAVYLGSTKIFPILTITEVKCLNDVSPAGKTQTIGLNVTYTYNGIERTKNNITYTGDWGEPLESVEARHKVLTLTVYIDDDENISFTSGVASGTVDVYMSENKVESDDYVYSDCKITALSIGNTLTVFANSTATVSGTYMYSYKRTVTYTSGYKAVSTGKDITATLGAGQLALTGSNFSLTGYTIKHTGDTGTSTTSNSVTEKVYITATHPMDSSVTKEEFASITNSVVSHSASASVGTVYAYKSSATISGSCTNTWTTGAKTSSSIKSCSIISQVGGRFSVSGTTLSHDWMGYDNVTDSCKISVTFADGETATTSTSVRNNYYDTFVTTKYKLTLANPPQKGAQETLTAQAWDVYQRTWDSQASSQLTETVISTGASNWHVSGSGATIYTPSVSGNTMSCEIKFPSNSGTSSKTYSFDVYVLDRTHTTVTVTQDCPLFVFTWIPNTTTSQPTAYSLAIKANVSVTSYTAVGYSGYYTVNSSPVNISGTVYFSSGDTQKIIKSDVSTSGLNMDTSNLSLSY